MNAMAISEGNKNRNTPPTALSSHLYFWDNGFTLEKAFLFSNWLRTKNEKCIIKIFELFLKWRIKKQDPFFIFSFLVKRFTKYSM